MIRNRIDNRPTVFIWATGQDDNIGDSLLRRPSIADARSRASQVHIFRGDSTPTFDTGLGLEPRDRVYRGFQRWALRAFASGFRRRTLVVANAGEVKVSRRGAVRLLAAWSASLAPRTKVYWIGAGVPGKQSIWAVPYKMFARRAAFAGFRDEESTDLLGTGHVVPDWAFALGTSVLSWAPLANRTKLAVVLRGDRSAPSERWLQWLKHLADQLGLTLVFVVQVRRDADLARALAKRIGGEVIEFEGDVSHATQESKVREIYGATRLVVGDRLHGLIVAATEGAIPLGWVESSTGKISRHFNAVEMPFVGEYEGARADSLPLPDSGLAEQWAQEVRQRVDAARRRIEAAQEQVDQLAVRG